MTKQEQIEEMAKIMFGYVCTRTKCDSCKYPNKQKDCEAYRNAEALYNAGYRKIPENAVVITNEEYKRLKILEKYHITCEDVYEYVVLARNETADKIFNDIFALINNAKDKLSKMFGNNSVYGTVYKNSINHFNEHILELAKKYGVEAEE